MFDYLAAQIAELKEDETTRALTLASCASNLESLLSMIRHGIAADRAEAPVASLEHARHMSARGASIDATLRFYRLGHAWFAERWNAELADRISGRAQLISAVRESAAFSFAYIDVVTSKVSADHVAERDRRQRRAAAVQAERARRVAQLTQRPSPSFTRFEDVALVDLLSRDLAAARALVRDGLGALAASGERPAVLRAAMLAYLSSYGSHAAAAASLGVHRNTVLLRLRRAEELRGRPAGQHSHELVAALLLAETLGDAVLIDG